ncbi:hypothetical protein [Mycoplasma sp. Ms02]|uniref:hypothetical protein n=1 Tax=Mycoplasma sp. Ms02 TaxID=353851 RepID=UPI001C8A9B37|nr:hypothetical protein [Mycoplasma sp. Ms02]QZE12164.1 hypothetical protein K4L35_02350 [Mycoplasma sp. Ms02]
MKTKTMINFLNTVEGLGSLSTSINQTTPHHIFHTENYKNAGVKWIVTNETRQTDLYNNGGYGGKNLEFKNIITNECFTLQDLLDKTGAELKVMGLQKVYNPARGVWYIRTLRNSIKVDNLG